MVYGIAQAPTQIMREAGIKLCPFQDILISCYAKRNTICYWMRIGYKSKDHKLSQRKNLSFTSWLQHLRGLQMLSSTRQESSMEIVSFVIVKLTGHDGGESQWTRGLAENNGNLSSLSTRSCYKEGKWYRQASVCKVKRDKQKVTYRMISFLWNSE